MILIMNSEQIIKAIIKLKLKKIIKRVSVCVVTEMKVQMAAWSPIGIICPQLGEASANIINLKMN